MEFVYGKPGDFKVIATVSMKDSEVIVESDDAHFKECLLKELTGENWKEFWKNLPKERKDELSKEGFSEESYGRFLRWTGDEGFGFHSENLTRQKPGDPFFLESLCGPWNDGKELWGYTDVFARRAGKIWKEEVPEEMLGG